MAIPLSSRHLQDEITWAYSKDGIYSVKTAYMLGKGGSLDDFHRAWSNLWGLEVSPKVRHFLWRVCTNSLPVRMALKRRHIIDEALCPRCADEEETWQHVLFCCPRIRRIWDDYGCKEMARDIEQEEFCDTLVRWEALDKKMVQKGCFLAWNVWAERNGWVFENKSQPLAIIAQRAGRQSDEFALYSTRIYGGTPQARAASPSIWRAPHPVVIKINADASVGNDGWIGLGVVARGSDGRVCFSAVRRQRTWWPPEIAECKAIHLAVRLARDHGLRDVLVESDSQVVTTKLSKVVLFYSDLDFILGDVLALSSEFNSISFVHVKRDGNTVAHNLARVVPFVVEQCWENHVPQAVAPYVLMDTLSMD